MIKKNTWVTLAVTGAFVFASSVSFAQQGRTLMTQNSNEEFIKQKTQQNKANVELSVWGGYMFGGKFDRYSYYYNIDNGVDYGGAASVEFAPNTWAEFSYNYMASSAEYRNYNQDVSRFKHEDVNVNYFQLGVHKVLPVHEVVKPFGLFTMGATYMNQSVNNDVWAFSMTAGGGLKIYVSDRIGLRLQGRFMVPMYFSGLGFGVGTGGVSGGAYFGAYALQGDFSGGLIFRL